MEEPTIDTQGIEKLVWCLLETSHYLNRLPFESEQERVSRAALNAHIENVLHEQGVSSTQEPALQAQEEKEE